MAKELSDALPPASLRPAAQAETAVSGSDRYSRRVTRPDVLRRTARAELPQNLVPCGSLDMKIHLPPCVSSILSRVEFTTKNDARYNELGQPRMHQELLAELARA